VSGVGEAEPVRGCVETSEKEGCELLRRRAVIQHGVGPLQAIGDAGADLGLSPDRGLEIGHQHRRRHAFPRGIAQTERHVVLLHLDEIEIIPAHLAGGPAATGDVIARDGRRQFRQEIDLQLEGQPQFLLHPLQGLLFLKQPAVLDHLRRLGPDDAQQSLVIVGEAVSRFFVEQRQHADHPSFRHQGHAQERPDGKFLIAGHVEAFVPQQVLHQQRPVIFEHPTGQLLVQPVGKRIAVGVGLAHLGAERVVASTFIQKQDGPLFHLEVLQAFLEGEAQDPVQRQGGVDGRGDLVQNGQFFDRPAQARVFPTQMVRRQRVFFVHGRSTLPLERIGHQGLAPSPIPQIRQLACLQPARPVCDNELPIPLKCRLLRLL